jgi:chemotaxis protein methyltransferase CheR
MRAASSCSEQAVDRLLITIQWGKDVTGLRSGTDNGQSSAIAGREFAFDDSDFAAIRTLVKSLTGINLVESKRELVYGRISRRLRALGMYSFRQYLDYLRSDGEQELVEFCNAITTNLTSFFRESHHFDHLRTHLADLHQSGQRRRLRIWSAACSTGEEPYSIAMTVCEAIPDWSRWDIRILATDLDSNVLAHAKRGVYTADRVKSMSAERIRRFFDPASTSNGEGFQVSSDLQRLIVFKQLNLIEPLPMKGPLDAVFCRNVIIYFDKETQRDLFARIAPLQPSGSLLYLGHSESLFKVSTEYSLLGKTIYERH